MKRFAIFVAAILLAQTLSAQIITSRSHSIIRESTALQKGYRGFAEGTLIINIKPTIANRCGFNISTIHGYQFNRWLYLGAGVGFEGNIGMMAVPVFADFRSYFLNTRRLKPFVELQLGYNISCRQKKITYNDWIWLYDEHKNVQCNDVYVYGKPHMQVGVGLEYKWFSLKFAYSLWYYTESHSTMDIEDGALINSRSFEMSWFESTLCIGIGFNF